MRIAMCHCFECQRRTGSVFASNARFRREQITRFGGTATEYKRSSDSGNGLTFRFCPVCGSTVYWEGESFPGLVAVAIGAFGDPAFPPPGFSVYERARHHWVPLPSDPPIEHVE